MKKYLIILLLIITTLTGCTTQSDNSIASNQMKVTRIRRTYLNNAISNVDNNIFNSLSTKDIVGDDITKLLLVQNEVPYLKNDLSTFDENIHTAFRLAEVKYQEILRLYANQLEFPLIYPDGNDYYAIETAGIDVLFDTYDDEISLEINKALDEIFAQSVKEYSELATNYNIYCESLTLLNRQSLTPINTSINILLKELFLEKVYNNIITTEKNYTYEKTSFKPKLINITY